MKLRELFENIYEEIPDGQEPAEYDGALKVIGICYGRWNPPHRGHREVWKEASKNPIWFIGTNENTEGPKDPLPYDIKIQCMAAVWSKVSGHVIPEQDLFTMATHIYEKHGENVHLKVYTDEKWLAAGLQKYNGQMEAKHGGYKFSQIDHVETKRLARATDLREYVRTGNKAAFYKDAGISPDTTIEVKKQQLPLFDVVAYFLNKYSDKRAIAEAGGMKPIDKEKKAAMKNATTIPGLNMATGSMYKNYRMGIALAGAPDYPTKQEADNWIGGDPLISSYTEQEFEMVKAAAKQVGAGRIQNWSGNRSKEIADVNKTSTVAKPKKNKYGV
jgi:nicotinamide mononucleotide adenylyltransferase